MSAAKTTDSCLPFGAALPPPATRPSWSGLLQLSLVGIPLKAYPAVRSREVSHFHQLHASQRIRYAKQCPVHGPVDAAAIVKGYEYGPETAPTQRRRGRSDQGQERRGLGISYPVRGTECASTKLQQSG